MINSGPRASRLLTEFVRETGYPITLTLMGLGVYPANDKQFLGLVGMHGAYESNLAMHGCDVMINIGARFDDRVTGRLIGVLAALEEDPRRHRPVLAQQDGAGRRADRRRLRLGARRHAEAVAGAEGQARRRRR